MTKILDTAGTLQLFDTGRRCSVRNVRILRVHCTESCSEDTFLHDAIIDAFWRTSKMMNGYHQGCDPNSLWRTDPAAAKLQQSTIKSLLDKEPIGACIACGDLDCTGAERGN